jgi:hypothetical protein
MNKFEEMPKVEQKDEKEKQPFSPEDSVPRSKGKRGQNRFEIKEK